MAGSRWHQTLTDAQQARVRAEIERQLGHKPSRKYHDLGGFSVVLDRSVGIPTRILLRRRNGDGRILYDVEIVAS